MDTQCRGLPQEMLLQLEFFRLLPQASQVNFLRLGSLKGDTTHNCSGWSIILQREDCHGLITMSTLPPSVPLLTRREFKARRTCRRKLPRNPYF